MRDLFPDLFRDVFRNILYNIFIRSFNKYPNASGFRACIEL